nr:HlyD family type I secretion periplasmic adaptor subunit [Pseudomonas antarctica]
MPAALALQEQPVHPAPRYILFSIMLFAALAFFWACLGEIDVVATATGKVVASGKSKTIQPSEVAVVKAIHVYDGEQVKVGDVLIELDASVTGADVRRLNSDLMAAKVDSTRAGAMLEAIQNHKEPGSLQGKINDAGPVQQLAAERWLQGQYFELKSALYQAEAEIDQRTAEIASANINVGTLQKTLPVSRRLAEDYKTLLEQQYVPRHAYLEKELALLDLERELALQRGRVNELKAAKKEAEGRWVGILAQTRRAMLDLQQQSEQKVASLTQEVSKAEQRDHLMRLTAPVDGMVQQLAVHTIGGVVTAAQPLMVVVPTDRPVEVEAMLENEVISVSNDAIEDEKRGLLYSVRVRLFSDFVTVKGKDISLVSGMSVSSNVKTDHRRIIDYLLSPLERHIAESMMEY